MPQAKILIVENRPIARLGIRQVIAASPDLSICGEADTAASALQLANSLRPDLLTVTLSLPDGNGLDLIRTIHDGLPTLPIIALSQHDEGLFAELALRIGARGYVMKREAPDTLRHAIDHVLAGRVFVSESILERFGHIKPDGQGLANLTDRERQVFELIGRGLSTTMIAAQLGVSTKTIETHQANIKRKLHLENAVDLLRCAAVWLKYI